jgi:hypothetical protein
VKGDRLIRLLFYQMRDLLPCVDPKTGKWFSQRDHVTVQHDPGIAGLVEKIRVG